MSSADQSGRRLPPCSEEAERGVLGSVLIDSKRVVEKAFGLGLSVESFYFPVHRILYGKLIEMYQAARPVDLLMVGEELKKTDDLDRVGGPAFLEGLVDSTPTSANAESYIEIVLQKSLLRRIIEQATDTITLCYNPENEDAESILNRTESSFFDLRDVRSSSAEDWPATVKQVMEKMEGKQSYGVPTGFLDLDDILKGLHSSDMIVLAARPSMGKTSLAMNIAENIALGKNTEHKKHAVGIFSLEMSQEQLVRRMLFSKAGVASWKDFYSAEDHARLVRAADELGKAQLVVDDSAGLDIMDLTARARRMKRVYGIDLIVIDYLQLLHDKRRFRDGRQIETASISNSIKKLAKDLQVPVLILSQLSRAPMQPGRDGRPRLSDLRDSGAIEQDADVVLLLDRPVFNEANKDKDGVDPLLANVNIAKHRNGKVGKVDLNFIDEYTRFENRESRRTEDFD